MANRPLTDILRELIDADRVRLPVHPRLARQVPECLAEEGPESQRLWELVGRDPALLCDLFRAANSSFFAGLPKTATVDEAVTRLGGRTAAQTVEQVCRESERRQPGPLLKRYMPSLWQHAEGCALGARWLAVRCGYQAVADRAYLAGMLHDIGKQFLLVAMEEVAANKEYGIAMSEPLIVEVLSSMHTEMGVRLFEFWNLAEDYREVVADHHEDELDTTQIVVALVKLANKGCRKVGLGLDSSPDLVLPTTGEAQFLGIDEIALAEFEIMLEDHFPAGR